MVRAVRIHEPGGPDALVLDDVDVPDPGPDELVVRVAAAGVNYIDTYQRSGAYPVPLPATLGMEAAGVVEAVGADVDGVAVGQRVAHAGTRGAYAERQVVASRHIVNVPDGVDTEVAAGAMLQGMTAHYLVTDTYALQPGDVALVHAAAGGVGHLLTQLCSHLGAHVVATCGTDEKAELAASYGADEVVVYTRDSVVDAVQRFTDGRGADVVYDGVGQATFADGLACLGPRGTMVLYGQASGPVGPVDPQTLNQHGSLFLTRPSLFHYTADRAELERRATDLFGWIAQGTLDVRIDQTFPLEEAGAAHRYLEGRQTRGKVLLAA